MSTKFLQDYSVYCFVFFHVFYAGSLCYSSYVIEYNDLFL